MGEYVTDRTEYDVAVAQDYFSAFWGKLDADERAEWLAGLKGAFKHTDFNRLAQITNGLLGTQNIPATYTMYNIPPKSKVELLFSGISELRDRTYGLTERDFVDYRSGGSEYDTSANGLRFDRLNYLEGGLQLAELFTRDNQYIMPIDFSIIADDPDDIYLVLDGYLTATADNQNFNLYMPKGYEVTVIQGTRSHGTWLEPSKSETVYNTITDGYGQTFLSKTENTYPKWWFSIEIRALEGYSIYQLDTSKIKVLLH